MAMQSGDPNNDDIVSDINMTPLIDIMLVLLIIFMVTSSLSLESGLGINLPKTSSKDTQGKQKEGILISLTKEGQIQVQGKEATLTTLSDLVKSAISKEGSTKVVFEGDTNSTLGKTIQIMDLAKAAGATDFAIATDYETENIPTN